VLERGDELSVEFCGREHGVLELPEIFIGVGGTGMRRDVFPGVLTRRGMLVRRAREVTAGCWGRSLVVVAGW